MAAVHWAAALLPAMLLLAGCHTLPPAAGPAPGAQLAGLDWPARRALLQRRDQFGLDGRVAVAAAGEGFSGHLRWSQRGELCTLQLDGPLGVGGLRVISDGTRLELTRASGEELDSAAARTELQSRLGFEPPLQHLRYWVQGVPDPALSAMETPDSSQRLAALVQDGWNITYTSYQTLPGGLPQRLTLTRGEVRVRLIIDSWHLP